MRKVRVKCPHMWMKTLKPCGKKQKVYFSEGGTTSRPTCKRCGGYLGRDDILQPKRYVRRALGWACSLIPRRSKKVNKPGPDGGDFCFEPGPALGALDPAPNFIIHEQPHAKAALWVEGDVYHNGKKVRMKYVRRPFRALWRGLSFFPRKAWRSFVYLSGVGFFLPKPACMQCAKKDSSIDILKAEQHDLMRVVEYWQSQTNIVKDQLSEARGIAGRNGEERDRAADRLREANATIRELDVELAKYSEGIWVQLRDQTQAEMEDRLRGHAIDSVEVHTPKATEWEDMEHISDFSRKSVCGGGPSAGGMTCKKCPAYLPGSVENCGAFGRAHQIRWPSGKAGEGQPEFRRKPAPQEDEKGWNIGGPIDFRPRDERGRGEWKPCAGEWAWSLYHRHPVKVIGIDGKTVAYKKPNGQTDSAAFPSDQSRRLGLRQLALSEVETEAQAKQFYGRKVKCKDGTCARLTGWTDHEVRRAYPWEGQNEDLGISSTYGDDFIELLED